MPFSLLPSLLTQGKAGRKLLSSLLFPSSRCHGQFSAQRREGTAHLTSHSTELRHQTGGPLAGAWGVLGSWSREKSPPRQQPGTSGAHELREAHLCCFVLRDDTRFHHGEVTNSQPVGRMERGQGASQPSILEADADRAAPTRAAPGACRWLGLRASGSPGAPASSLSHVGRPRGGSVVDSPSRALGQLPASVADLDVRLSQAFRRRRPSPHFTAAAEGTQATAGQLAPLDP